MAFFLLQMINILLQDELGYNDHGNKDFMVLANIFNTTFLVPSDSCSSYINAHGYNDLTVITVISTVS